MTDITIREPTDDEVRKAGQIALNAANSEAGRVAETLGTAPPWLRTNTLAVARAVLRHAHAQGPDAVLSRLVESMRREGDAARTEARTHYDDRVRVEAERDGAWLEYLGPARNKMHCGLCGNSGVVDTRPMYTAAGYECGVLAWCICPNGRALKRGGADMAGALALKTREHHSGGYTRPNDDATWSEQAFKWRTERDAAIARHDEAAREVARLHVQLATVREVWTSWKSSRVWTWAEMDTALRDPAPTPEKHPRQRIAVADVEAARGQTVAASATAPTITVGSEPQRGTPSESVEDVDTWERLGELVWAERSPEDRGAHAPSWYAEWMRQGTAGFPMEALSPELQGRIVQMRERAKGGGK